MTPIYFEVHEYKVYFRFALAKGACIELINFYKNKEWQQRTMILDW